MDKPTPYVVLMVKADRAAIAAANQAKMRRSAMSIGSRRRWLRRQHGYARQAVALYEKALRAKPNRAEPHYRAATVMYFHFFAGQPERCHRLKRMCLQVINHWHGFEKAAPLDPRNLDYLFQRALLYTTLAEKRYYKKAVADYMKLINSTRFLSMGRDRATTLGNLAEIYMMLTDIDKALPMYKRALAAGDQALHAYGMAVALDRDGRGEKARELMRRYAEGRVNRATGKLKELSRDGVFFVPAGEIYYYHALSYEARGELGSAVVYYQKFLSSGAHPKFQARAKENLKRLRKQLLTQFKKQPPMISPVLP